MKTIHSTRFIANSNVEDDKSGIGVFEFEDITYEIPLNEIKHFFEIIEIIKRYKHITKLDTLNSVKLKLDIMYKETLHLDY